MRARDRRVIPDALRVFYRARHLLSDEELKIMVRVAEGRSYREIGDELGVCHNTIWRRVARAAEKVNTKAV